MIISYPAADPKIESGDLANTSFSNLAQLNVTREILKLGSYSFGFIRAIN
jgi:hypothetical protein